MSLSMVLKSTVQKPLLTEFNAICTELHHVVFPHIIVSDSIFTAGHIVHTENQKSRVKIGRVIQHRLTSGYVML